MEEKKVLLFLVKGFEELEALAPVDLLRRAGIHIDTVSITDSSQVVSSRNITVLADKLIKDIDFEDYDMIVLPGGPGTENYFKSEILLDQIDKFALSKKIAAICAAPTVLLERGVLEGKRVTCFPAYEEELKGRGVEVILENVSKDGNIITGKAAGASIDFALAIIEEISGKEKALEIKDKIFYS